MNMLKRKYKDKNYQAINYLERYEVNNYMALTSFTSYLLREEIPIRRKLMYYCIVIMVWLYTIKYGILIKYHDHSILAILGEPVHMIVSDRIELVFAILFLFGLISSSVKLLMMYFEVSHKFEILEVYNHLREKTPNYR